MKKRVLSIIIGLLFFQTGIVFSQQPEEIIKKFFNNYKEKSVDNAFEYIYSDNFMLDVKEEVANESKNGFVELTKNLGKYYDYNIISNEKSGNDYIKYNVMAKFDKAPARIIFTFYKPNDKWRIIEFSYTKQIDDKTPVFRQIPLKNLK